MTVVVDASALVEALAGREPRASAVRARLRDDELHAPYVIEVEVLQAFRRLARSRELSEDRAADARDDLVALPLVLYPQRPFAGRIWELRDTMTAYDACYVALAETLEAPLVTTDGRLRRSSGTDVQFEVIR